MTESDWYRIIREHDGYCVATVQAGDAEYALNQYLEQFGERDVDGNVITRLVLMPTNRPWGIGK